MFVKSRAASGTSSQSTSTVFGSNVGPPLTSTLLAGAQVTQTENHPSWYRSGGRWDAGGPFNTKKVEVSLGTITEEVNANYYSGLGWQYSTRTRLAPDPRFGGLTRENHPLVTHDEIATFVGQQVQNGLTAIDLVPMGSKAIAACSPTNPTVDLSTSLAELWSEQRFFSVPGTSGNIGGEYLNYQFGVAPTLADARALRHAIENADSIIEQYRKDAGRNIRRRYNFPPETSTKVSESVQPCATVGYGLTSYQSENGTMKLTTTTTTRTWFSGAFRYSIPQGSLPSRVSELDRLYGIVPGVGTAWELVPFSWLVDWFTPVGSVLQNMDAYQQNGLVLPYAYIMSTTDVVDHYEWRGRVRNAQGSWSSRSVYGKISTSSSTRIPASPFGFGKLWTDFSPKQLAILAALGISRGSR